MERLSRAEQRLLEAASVAGLEFSSAEVAAAIEREEVNTEDQCEDLARRQQFLRPAGMNEWPDGMVAARYGFRHAVYQALWQERVKAGRWRRYHQLIGERKERGYGNRADEIAAELALHFEQGRDYHRAVQYYQAAGNRAWQRSGNVETIAHLSKGLELLKTLPDTPERTEQELLLQITLGPALMATRGYAAPEVENTYARARELCRQVGETPQLVPVLLGLWRFDIVRAELRTARELGGQMLAIAQRVQDPAIFLEAHLILGATLLALGEFVSAQGHLEKSLALYNPQQHRSHAVRYGLDPKVGGLSRLAEALWFLGYPDHARRKSDEALTLARELAHPFSLAYALSFAGELHQHYRERPLVREQAEAMIVLATEQDFPVWRTWGTVLRSWALTGQGQREKESAHIQQGVVAGRAMTRGFLAHFFILLADAYGQVEQAEAGLNLLAEALTVVSQTEDRRHEAELYRLKGELTLQSSVQSLGSSVKTSEKSKVKSQQGARDWGLGAGSLSPQAPSLKPQVPSGVVREAEGCFLKAIESLNVNKRSRGNCAQR